MDLKKTGAFIKESRKAKGLTQEQLAEKLNISFKTVSKWECGNGFPDVSIMAELCAALSITVNDLLNGEHIDSKDYINKAEQKLIELHEMKIAGDKRLLDAEIIIGSFATIVVLISIVAFAILIEQGYYLYGILSIVFGFLLFIPSVAFCLLIEQKAGYYECKKCGHRFIPTYSQVFWAPHSGRTRWMKCPHCHEKSWCKKVIK
ncbi:MAG TPA: helix-turn-helix domain-containing protein [Bacilli bacterium]|nr:helix-turn-helix domain-containing protein [Bacilli bacterium]